MAFFVKNSVASGMVIQVKTNPAKGGKNFPSFTNRNFRQGLNSQGDGFGMFLSGYRKGVFVCDD